MIPPEIKKEHVLKAAKWIDEHGVPRARESTIWLVIIEGKTYPPKYIISRANVYANGTEWPSGNFTGGEETNSYLKNLGFKICDRGSFTVPRDKAPEPRPCVKPLKGPTTVMNMRGMEEKTPIDRIIVDGSNVACFGMGRDSADLSQLIKAYGQLRRKYGFSKIRIIIGPRLRHIVGQDSFDGLLSKFEHENERRGERILYQAPARSYDDSYIIKYAIEHDFLILTNDLFRDHAQAYPGDAKELERRLVRYMIMDGDLSIPKFPAY